MRPCRLVNAWPDLIKCRAAATGYSGAEETRSGHPAGAEPGGRAGSPSHFPQEAREMTTFDALYKTGSVHYLIQRLGNHDTTLVTA